MEIVAGVGQMRYHHIAKGVSVHLVVYAAMRMPVYELFQWLRANSISVKAKHA